DHLFTVDTTPPHTSITLSPSGATSSTSASFSFASSETGASFQCSLDGGAWTACSSPRNYSGLTAGSHSFAVRAIDAAGNADPDSASATWTVDLTVPAVRIDAPADGSSTNDGSLLFSGLAGTAAGDDVTVTAEIFHVLAGGPDALAETRTAVRSSRAR